MELVERRLAETGADMTLMDASQWLPKHLRAGGCRWDSCAALPCCGSRGRRRSLAIGGAIAAAEKCCASGPQGISRKGAR